MSVKLEVFYDYICPYCLRAHEYLMSLLPKFPGLEIEWRPTEAHPRPEIYGLYSDLCCRGMYYAQEVGSEQTLAEYHKRMYQAACVPHTFMGGVVNIEDINVITELMDGVLDKDKLSEFLSSNRYEDTLQENNRLVWDEYDCPAVPSYRIGGAMLKSKYAVGVFKDMLEDFLKEHFKES
jgi:predicted DsbA family dithiol-disulfide isomerase